jgi:hypothetical protein
MCPRKLASDVGRVLQVLCKSPLVETIKYRSGGGTDSHIFDEFASVSFSPDGKRVITCCRHYGVISGMVKMWDAENGTEVRLSTRES